MSATELTNRQRRRDRVSITMSVTGAAVVMVAALVFATPVAIGKTPPRVVHIYDGTIVIDHRMNPPYLGLRSPRIRVATTPERRARRARRAYLMALRCSMGPHFIGPEWGRRYHPFSKRGRLLICPERYASGSW